VSIPFRKNILVSISPKSLAYSLHPSTVEGVYRDRHGRWARDAMDVLVLLKNGADADGEVVWS
jgi:hypothetical protein